MGSLIYFGQRFYDPALGRWLTPDPSGFAEGAQPLCLCPQQPLKPARSLRTDLRRSLSSRPSPGGSPSRDPAGKSNSLKSILPCKGFLSDVPIDWVVTAAIGTNFNSPRKNG